jgi:hypothetical protein
VAFVSADWLKTRQVRRGQPGGWLLSFVRPKESNQRKRRPGTPALRATLRRSSGRAAAQLAHWLDMIFTLRAGLHVGVLYRPV